MPRFFIPEEPGEEYLLDGENGRHALRSLRMRPGEALTLCAGTGKDFHGEISECREDGALVRVLRVEESRGEPRARVTVCQCWAKGDKMEMVTQKCVELGAAAIWPMESARCVVKLDGRAAEKKTARLQKIALEAAQQSGRGIVPRVAHSCPLEQGLRAAAEEGSLLFCYEEGTASLREALKTAGENIFVFIGPEGGFSPEEAALAESLGAGLLTLGPRILRTETAPLAALAAILYERGEFERK